MVVDTAPFLYQSVEPISFWITEISEGCLWDGFPYFTLNNSTDITSISLGLPNPLSQGIIHIILGSIWTFYNCEHQYCSAWALFGFSWVWEQGAEHWKSRVNFWTMIKGVSVPLESRDWMEGIHGDLLSWCLWLSGGPFWAVALMCVWECLRCAWVFFRGGFDPLPL